MRIQNSDVTQAILGYGRDLNGNGVIETFFLKGKDGIKIYRREEKGVTHTQMALRYLAVHGSNDGKQFYKQVTKDILGVFLMSVNKVNQASRIYFENYMDLEELRIKRADKRHLLTREERNYLAAVYLRGHQIAENTLKRSLEEAFKLVAADALLWLGGGALLKGAVASVSSARAAAGASSAAVAGRIALRSYPQTLGVALRGLTAKSALIGSKNLFLRGLRGVGKEWRYIALSTGTQIGVESYVNYHSIKDPNPRVLAQNLMTHQAIRENVAISLTDSLLMAGAANMTQNKRARFALLGMVGATSSLGVGTALNGNQSATRVAFDAAWGIGIDTTSLLVELKALHHFQEKAVQTKNPRLKLVGYAIVFVSQVAGHWGYSKATKYVESSAELQSGQVVLVPVTASLR